MANDLPILYIELDERYHIDILSHELVVLFVVNEYLFECKRLIRILSYLCHVCIIRLYFVS
ncbi:hypothetical protein HanRHA438_Chr05g0224911 [Helianthus annuus]|nr:hypothetical protein HanRHA438_Chr05g0224911 [Helianthus annuus]